MNKYKCIYCHYEYSEADGEPSVGIKSGTKWEDVDPDWRCPHCGAKKGKFNIIDEVV